MILFLNVYITNNFITKYDRGLLGEDEDRVNIFLFSLASYSVIEWEQVIIYYDLDEMYSHRYNEIDTFIKSQFNNPSIYHYRNNKQSKWQKAIESIDELKFDGLIWFCCNDDHVFIDKDTSYLDYLKSELIELNKKYDYLSCYFSHWPEMVRMVDTRNKYASKLIKNSKNYFLIKWKNIDSIQIVNKKLLRYWWFENDYGDANLVRSDTPSSLGGVPVICPEMITLIPYKEIVRHFDGYSHVNISINDCPPLFIPEGFFTNDIKVSYCVHGTDSSYLNIDPRKINYSTIEKNGADYKCLLDEIPKFLKNRISKIEKDERIGSNQLISSRNKAVLRLASADRKRSKWPPWKIKRKIENTALISYPNFNRIRLLVDSFLAWDIQEYREYLTKSYPILFNILFRIIKKFSFIKKIVIKLIKAPTPFLKKTLYSFDYYLGIVWSISMGNRSFIPAKNSTTPLVLICRNQFYSDKNNAESLEKFYIDDSLEKRNLDLDHYFWDSTRKPFFNQIKIFENFLMKNPSLIIFSSYSTDENKRTIMQPSLPLLKKLRERTNARLIALWWDTCSNHFLASANKIFPFFDLNIINDNPQFSYNNDAIDNVLKLWTPFNPLSFQPQEKDIDVVFLGQISAYRQSRREYINYLIESNIDAEISILDRNSQVSHKEYHEKLSRAKIGLNFSFSVDQHQLKGRVFETMLSGGMLLESKNPQTATLFNEGQEYVSFSTKEDLVEKIKYYIENENERNNIAIAGRKKVMERYSDKNYWDIIFNNIDLNE